MVIRPDTVVRLLSNVPVDPTYENVQFFDTQSEQTAFFLQEKFNAGEFTKFNYIQQQGVIRVPVNIEQLWNVNYVMYQNHAFGNKWFYAFVDRIEWSSDNATDIIFRIDVFQTWIYNCRFFKTYVLRETVSDDSFGENLVDEGLETGEYVVNVTHDVIQESESSWQDQYAKDRYLAVYTSYGTEQNDINIQLNGTSPDGGEFDLSYIIPNTVKAANGGEMMNGSYSGSVVQFFLLTPENVESQINPYIKEMTQKGQIDAITAMYVCLGICRYGSAEGAWQVTWFMNRPGSLDGYVPRNNKLFTEPYAYVSMTNNSGDVQEYGYEYLEYTGDTDQINFNVRSTYVGQPVASISPRGYKGTDGVPYMVYLNNFPLASFSYSAYQNELGLNRMSNTWAAGRTAVKAVGNVIGGVFGENGLVGGIAGAIDPTDDQSAVGALLGGVGGLVTSVASSVDEIGTAVTKHIDRARAPMSTSGVTEPAHLLSIQKVGFYAREMSVRADYARRIDDYFSMYGYKVDKVKDLEFHSRRNWNFIKTIGCNVEGDCPAPVVEAIKAIFNRGVTLWHTGDFDYKDLQNPII